MNQVLSDQSVSHPLLPLESSWYLMEEQGIAAVTFYHGNPDSVVGLLQERLIALLKANPWLTGRLQNDGRSKQLKLVYSRYFNEVDVVSRVFICKPEGVLLSQNQSYEHLCKQALTCIVDKGSRLLRNQAPLIKLSLLPVSEGDNDKFALVFSVSHIVADGYTFYTLLNSLFSASQPPELQPKRELEASEKIPWTVGEKEYNYIFSARFFLNVMRGMLFGKARKTIAYYVDNERVDLQKSNFKQQAADPNLFISTNDIVTSGFVRAVGSRLCMSAINLRNRVPGIDFRHAGNYEAALLYDGERAKTPEGVRAALAEGPPFKPTLMPLPGFWQGVSCRIAVITNWATFTGDLTLLECRQIIHIPLHAKQKMPFDFTIVFEPNPGQTGLLIFAKRASEEQLLEHCPLEKIVFGKVFE